MGLLNPSMTHSPHHHPDVRWLIAITAVVTALAAGGLAYVSFMNDSAADRVASQNSPLALQIAKIEELQRRNTGLQDVVASLQYELKAARENPQLPAVSTSSYNFGSKHGLAATFPAGWQLVAAPLDAYDTLSAAQAAGANFFVMAWPGATPAQTTLVQVQVFADNVPATVSRWITAEVGNGAKTEDFMIGGQPAKRVRSTGSLQTPGLSYYQIANNRGLRIQVTPATTTRQADLEQAFLSLKFTSSTP